MSNRLYTTQEKLGVIEGIIRDYKHYEGALEHHRFLVLKAIASDLRGRLDGAPSAVLADLEQRVTAVLQSVSVVGYNPHKLHELGQGVVVRWPTLKQALERLDQENVP